MITQTLSLHLSVWGFKHRGIPFITKVFLLSGTSIPEYLGMAPRGSATSDAKWLIYKFFYDVNNNFDHSLCSADDVVMDNYASLTYS